MSKYLDSMGRYRTESLFLERSYGKNNPDLRPVYTLKDRDHEGLRSAKQLYVMMQDPAEYAFAKEFLGSYEHWKKLCNCPWFQPYLTEWRHELEVKMRSQAVMSIHEMSTGDNSTALAAAKYIAERGWDKSKANQAKRGRPTKEEVEHERKVQADMDTDMEAALERINKVH